MKPRCFPATLMLLWSGFAPAQVPDNVVVEGVPPFSDELRQEVGRYLEFRAADFQGWHPRRREMLITTRFADTAQLHLVQMPAGERWQLTFRADPVRRGSFRPKTAGFIVFQQDQGGDEFYQLYRLDPDGRITLLTDGKSRNLAGPWSKSGRWLAYTSTRRNGRDADVYTMDPADSKTDRLIRAMEGGGWTVLDWSPDDTKLLLGEYISINESYLHLLDLKSGELESLTPKTAESVAWSDGRFANDGKHLFVTTDRDSEFRRLYRFNLATKKLTPFGSDLKSDVESFDLSPDNRSLAFVSNERGASVLHLIEVRSGRELQLPHLPSGVIRDLRWQENSRELGFTLSSARLPGDCWSLDTRTMRFIRWTDSETGGLNAATFVEPKLIRFKSFDGLEISAFLYRPDPKKFPGPRPVLINIHGGPESQARPAFQARYNYFINELGMTLICPNVRGSAGFGKSFLALDNGRKREDAVKDIGALLDWVQEDKGSDASRVAVMGGSYGGYLALATMTHYNDRLRCGVDLVGITDFLTFLQNTQDYRRDLRRAEYGDERDPAMAEYLARIAPTANVKRITKPMLVVQGFNDPRVPATQSEQMVQALQAQGTPVWYLAAKDEGHGFRKKENVDFQFLAVVEFLEKNLLK